MGLNVPESGVFRISASAGSGKTYSLTRLFIRRLLRDRNAYRGMLAITFTNKAANELRERILKRLHELSNPELPAGEDDFFGFADRKLLAERASEILKTVLHQSEFLQVGTIDSFFQQIFSHLAIELGLPPGLKTEINLQGIKAELLEEGLMRQDPEAMRILIENLRRQLQYLGKDWRTLPYLRKHLLDSVFEEPVVRLFLSGKTDALSEDNLKKAASVLEAYVNSIKKEVKDSAFELQKKLEELGIRPEMLDAELEQPFINEIRNVWDAAQGKLIPNRMVSHFSKGKFHHKLKSRPFTNAEIEVLQPFILRYGESRNDRPMANLTHAENLLRNLFSVRLLLYFRSVLQDLNKTRNRFLLNEVKFLLAGFLDQTEVPYLFEKSGSQLHTLLIDEFQDTDKTQWKVLKALASVVIDNGGLLAVVGDVKQSIYGWRGADSTLFKSGLNRDLTTAPIVEESLEWNYRSEHLVVEFNNWLFKNLVQDFASSLQGAGHVVSITDWEETILKNYEDVQQKAASAESRPHDGFVEVRLRPKPGKAQAVQDEDGDEEETPGAFNWLPSEIMRLQDAGFKASDIAVLVRTNADSASVIRALDQAQRAGYSGYDFSFSTAASGKASSQALFTFLVLLLRHGSGKKIQAFELEQIRRLGIEIGLEDFFLSPEWSRNWLECKFRERDLDGILQEQSLYFGLDKLPSQQLMLVRFQDLLSAYLREDAFQQPDFFSWWQEKADQFEVPLAAGGSGITVMTIHRSKGLDFGVVILPVFSTAQGDSKALHDAVFWATGQQEPWNCHPLLRSKASKNLLVRDRAVEYQEDVFARAAEALNTFYVACTRPRYGLIIDITSDAKLDKPESSIFRIPIRTAVLLNKDSFPFDPESYSLESEEDGLLLKFRLGKVGIPISLSGKRQSTSGDVGTGRRIRMENHTFKPHEAESSVMQRTGILVHRILEKTSLDNQWEALLKLEKDSGFWQGEEITQAHADLSSLFEIQDVRNWFSGDWKSYPEQSLISSEGRLLRADRILIQGNRAVILDFKTGESSAAHLKQMEEYIRVFEQASGLKTEGWLLNSQEKNIRKVEVE